MLYSILYISKAADLSEVDLLDIKSSSSKNNRGNDISGALLYKEEEFLQILEGEEMALLRTYERICGDSRHSEIKLLYQGRIDKRDYGNWDMKYSHVDAQNFQMKTGVDSFFVFFNRTLPDKALQMGTMLIKEFADLSE